MNRWLRLGLEIGPLVVFFAVNARAGILPATAAFMVATVVALAVSYARERRFPVMPLVAGVFIMAFGALTLVLADDTFIKLKPTVANAFFALALFGGLALRRNLLKTAFGQAFRLDDEGWRRLTWRWAWFFAFLALLNEAVWRTQTTDAWVAFKVFGLMPLTLVFSLAQLPLILRHQLPDPEAGA